MNTFSSLLLTCVVCLLMQTMGHAQASAAPSNAGQVQPAQKLAAAATDGDRIEHSQVRATSQFKTFTDDLSSFSASFEQQVFDANGQQEEFSEGVFYLLQPNLMHWAYQHPYPQQIIADGSTLWSWDVELEQITRREQSAAEQQSPLTLLTEPERLQQQFELVDLGIDDQGMAWMQLRPQTEAAAEESEQLADFTRILVAFQNQLLKLMVLEDSLGQRTEVRFTQALKNPRLDADLFKFTPPAGVDVLDG